MTPFGNFVSWPKIWLMTLPKEHCPTGGVCMVAKLKKSNLTLMTLISELCQLAEIWLMTLPWEHCPTGGVFMVAKLNTSTI